MPFTPKFVDMVRNLTTSTGTGAINLGSTPSGFTGLSAALSTGDQFYYCIQGVDKPSEREVGRGTMLANGTIARDAISGGLTNFTPGTKTIALVTAAEWFAKIEQGGTAASGSANWISVADFLEPVRTPFVTDDLPAFQAAVAAALASGSTYGGGSRLLIPEGRYYCSAMWAVDAAIHIEGAGDGTVIRFGKNVDGIDLQAAGCVLEGVQLWGGNVNVNGAGTVTSFNAGDSISGSGVLVGNDDINCRGVRSYFFGGDGFYIAAGVEDQANTFLLERCFALYNRGRGFFVNGVDANAGTMIGCTAISNGGAGFLDYSFLGNTYIQCHVRDCGVDDPTTAGVGTGGPTGTCQYPAASGIFYYMVAGQEVAASTTVPGSNTAVWRTFLGHPSCKTWVNGMTWVNPSPYGTNPANTNGRNVFLGCYAESAQAPCQAAAPSLFLGGLLDETTVVGTAAWVRGTSNGGLGCGDFLSINPDDGTNRTFFGNPDGKTIFEHQRGTTYAKLRGRSDFGGKKALDLQLDNSFAVFNVGLEPTHAYGYGSMTIGRLFVGRGDVSGAIQLGTLNEVADINGQAVAAGATFLDSNPILGTPAGWVCTAGGTVGAGAMFADLAPLGLAAATAAEVRAGAATNRFASPANLFAAAAPVTLTDGATVTIDGATGFNFNLTLAGNRTLANPTNMKPGQSGRIRVKQDATGNRTLAYGANWLFAGGDPTLSTAANAIDVIAYFVNSPTEIEATIVKALA